MTDHTPSGQQAVEPWQIVRASMVEQAGDDNPSRVARNILHALRNAGFTVSRTHGPPFRFRRYVHGEERAEGVAIEHETTLESAMRRAAQICPITDGTVLVLDVPTAPSTAAGEREKLREALLIFQNHGFPMCGGDCGSANPPVSSCPMQEARAALATPPAQHTDDVAVDRFAVAMKEKLKHAREVKGRGGWQNCDPFDLSVMLRDHVEKGDPLDVANFCMMLWSLGCNIERLATPPAQGVEEETETLENLIDAAIGARTAPPWEEQAAQIRRDALEEAARCCQDARASAQRNYGVAEGFGATMAERRIRALLYKPAKGDTTNAD